VRARVTGVAFFDFDHGQAGVAPYAIELHSVLRFRNLSRHRIPSRSFVSFIARPSGTTPSQIHSCT
jgi:hypothetical protein